MHPCSRNLRRKTRGDHHNLPDDIVEYIFSFLSIKFAVQIALLAKRFRHSWIMNRNLDFNEDFAKGRKREAYIGAVDRVIKLHSGPKICKLRICLDPENESSRIEEWIGFATKKGVEELDLDFSKGRSCFKISSCLFNCTTVRMLKLSVCDFHPPSSFSGLRSLKILVLRKIKLSKPSIQMLLSNCFLLEVLDLWECFLSGQFKISNPIPRLKRLSLMDCHYLEVVDFDAPNISSLNFCGNFPQFNFISGVSKINKAMLKFKKIKKRELFDIKKVLCDLAHVEVLTINSYHFQGLATDFVNLKELQLVMEKDCYWNPLDFALFLSNCPCLERLFLDLQDFSFECGTYWELHSREEFEQLNCSFRHLKTIKWKGFKLQKYELLLMKYFVKNAFALETVVLITPKRSQQKIHTADVLEAEKMMQFRKQYPKAKIVVYEHERDDSCLHPIHSKIWKR